MSLFSRFANLWRSRALDREFDDELNFHHEMELERQRQRGFDPGEADARARRHIGSVLRAKEGMRQARAMVWLESIGADIRYGARLLRRRPGLAALAVVKLSLRIGANTALLTPLHPTLRRPLPYDDPDRLVVLFDRFAALGVTAASPPTPEILDVRDRNHV